jgi:hypothetical protein
MPDRAVLGDGFADVDHTEVGRRQQATCSAGRCHHWQHPMPAALLGATPQRIASVISRTHGIESRHTETAPPAGADLAPPRQQI